MGLNMKKYTLIGKLFDDQDTFFTGLVRTNVKDDEYLNRFEKEHFFIAGVPVEEFIDIRKALGCGGITIQYLEDNDVCTEAEEYWANLG
jgi:hypothetical protein